MKETRSVLSGSSVKEPERGGGGATPKSPKIEMTISSRLMFKTFTVSGELYRTLMNLTPALREAALEFLYRNNALKEEAG